MKKFIMMVGLPASGKSTIAKKYAEKENAIIISTDELREELLGDEASQENNELVFKEAEKRIKENLNNNKNVIFDATNLSYKRRMNWLDKLHDHKTHMVAILVATPYEECIERNLKRERKVPEEVIKNMYYNFYVPQYCEGFSEIIVEYNSDYKFTFEDLKDISQDNPHHRLSVLEHCKMAEKYSSDLASEKGVCTTHTIVLAALLHDIGKLKTKTFINTKGEETEIGHFYNHEKVGAYDSLFYETIKTELQSQVGLRVVIALRIIKLIQWHMLLWLDLSDKSIKKYKKFLGSFFWYDLQLLHIADKEAH